MGLGIVTITATNASQDNRHRQLTLSLGQERVVEPLWILTDVCGQDRQAPSGGATYHALAQCQVVTLLNELLANLTIARHRIESLLFLIEQE